MDGLASFPIDILIDRTQIQSSGSSLGLAVAR